MTGQRQAPVAAGDDGVSEFFKELHLKNLGGIPWTSTMRVMRARGDAAPTEAAPQEAEDEQVRRVDLWDSHGRWKGPCLQTAHMTI